MRTMTTEVVIIGGGVIGCAIAFYLAKKGIEAVVLEADFIAAMGSGRSHGALRTQGRHKTELPLAIESKTMFPTLNDEFDYDTEYRKSGHLLIVYSEEFVSVLEATYKRQEELGYSVSKLISPEEVYKLVPTLPREIAAGLYCATDGQVNPLKLTTGYYLGAKKSGAKILTHSPVKKINVSGGRVVSVDAGDLTVKANWVVNAAGIHAKEISKTIGIDIPIASLIFEILVTEPLPPFITPVLGCPEKKFGFRQTSNGNVLFCSSVPNDLTYDMAVTREKLKERVKLMISVFPQLADVSIIRSFAGLFDITPDLVPIIDTFENPQGYFLAAGFSGHGLAIGPAVGKQVAEWIGNGKPSMGLGEFRYSRFSEREISEWGKQKGKYTFMSYAVPKK